MALPVWPSRWVRRPRGLVLPAALCAAVWHLLHDQHVGIQRGSPTAFSSAAVLPFPFERLFRRTSVRDFLAQQESNDESLDLSGRRQSRRLALLLAATASVHEAPARAVEEPSAEELKQIASAFAAMAADPARSGAKQALDGAEDILNNAVPRYEGPLQRSGPERAMLRMGRARTRVMLNDLTGGQRPEKAAQAVEDYDVAIGIMEDEFRQDPGKPLYSEYPDALVRRALAKEELKQWAGAVEDYTRAINLWRPPPGTPDIPLRGNARPAEGNGLGVNPLVLNFRGNALSQIGKYEEALVDYQEATDIFLADGEFRQASLSRANEALALYGADRQDEAVQTMQSVIRKDPGVTDMHVALASVYWGEGKVGRAEDEWQFACEKIDTGCQQYKDLTWVSQIRRWPPTLVEALRRFLGHVGAGGQAAGIPTR